MTDVEIRAIELYNRSAGGQGFIDNAPWWNGLTDAQKQFWLDEAKRRLQPPQMGKTPK